MNQFKLLKVLVIITMLANLTLAVIDKNVSAFAGWSLAMLFYFEWSSGK